MHCNNCGCEFDATLSSCPVCGMKVNTSRIDNNAVDLNKNESDNTANKDTDIPESGFGSKNFYNTDNINNNQAQNRNPFYGQNNYNEQPKSNIRPDAPDYTLFLIIGILYTMCCCNWILGVIGIILTVQMNSAYRNGDINSYKHLKTSVIIIYVASIVMYVFSFIIGLAWFGMMELALA